MKVRASRKRVNYRRKFVVRVMFSLQTMLYLEEYIVLYVVRLC